MLYVTAGLIPDWLDLVEALVVAGADGIEVGIPFSDPSIDGRRIQDASVVALQRGTTPMSVVGELAGRSIGVPLVVMTYYNLAFRAGERRFAAELASADVDGTIFSDLPMEMRGPWNEAAAHYGIANVLLAAPSTSPPRLEQLTAETQGSCSGQHDGTTGERDELADTVSAVAVRAKALTDKPVLVGFGTSEPRHAVAATARADGVIVASALMRRILDGAGMSRPSTS